MPEANPHHGQALRRAALAAQRTLARAVGRLPKPAAGPINGVGFM